MRSCKKKLLLAFLQAGILCVTGSRPALASPGFQAQEQDARRALSSPMLPPQDVKVQFQKKQAVVTWQPVLLDRFANYEVYRWNGKGGEHWEKIGTATTAKFLDAKPPGKNALYKVVVVDRYGTKSPLSMSDASVVVGSRNHKLPDR